jgi:hypothetical protein
LVLEKENGMCDRNIEDCIRWFAKTEKEQAEAERARAVEELRHGTTEKKEAAQKKLAAIVASLNPGDKVRATYPGISYGPVVVEGFVELSSYGNLKIFASYEASFTLRSGTEKPIGSALVSLEVLSRALPEEPGSEVLITSASCPSIWRLIDTGWWWDVTGVTPLRTWAELNDRYAPLTVMVPKS